MKNNNKDNKKREEEEESAKIFVLLIWFEGRGMCGVGVCPTGVEKGYI